MVTNRNQELFPFEIGMIDYTEAAWEAMEAAGQNPMELVYRHAMGDWGVVSDADARDNNNALVAGDAILSEYVLGTGVRVWVLTNASRSETTIAIRRGP